MHIWVVTVGEPIPSDGKSVRLLRSGILINYLIERGHTVTWWNSAYDHSRRLLRTNQTTKTKINDKLDLYLLYGGGYKKNISLKRFLDHYLIAREFKKFASVEKKPDIILCSMPTIELAYQVAKYKKKFNVPYILDIRDLWPDIFYDFVIGPLKNILKLALIPMSFQVKYACKNADAIMGHTPLFVDWGVNHADRKSRKDDKDFPFGYMTTNWNQDQISEAKVKWKKMLPDNSGNGLTLCFFGTIASQFDLETVIAAAKILEKKNYQFNFVICGDGDNLLKFKKLAGGSKSVFFPGWVGALEIRALMEVSDLGIAPYFNNSGFDMSIPNKLVEYFSGGLPVVSSLQGYCKEFIRKQECGFTYSEGNSEELADLLEELLRNQSLVNKFSQNALEGFNHNFRADVVYGNMSEHLESVVRERK